ncbi:MAG: hypothetical protein PHP31_00145 [Lentimicrobiaceae bacterium]|nr:hypothetical protein [Lentimicrobiaceae bacterium]
MRFLKINLLMIFLVISGLLSAQNEMDALRYSRFNYSGSARFVSMGGAFGAVGADYSATVQNPAGMGLYRQGEFLISPFLNFSSTKSNFLNESHSDNRSTMYLGNASFVYVVDENKPVSVQLGIGVNSTNTFSNRVLFRGYNDQNSILTSYRDKLNSGISDPFGNELAVSTELIYEDTATNMYVIDMAQGQGITQTKTIKRTGGVSETNFSASVNIHNYVFLGFSLGLTNITYTENGFLTETDDTDNIRYFKAMSLREKLNTDGSGINAKLGVIVQPTNFMRIGAAIHTPTAYYDITDEWNSTVTSEFDNGFKSKKDSPKGKFDYRINTPLRAIGSMAFIIGQHAIISGDYEYTDYSKANLRSDTYAFIDENSKIERVFKPSHNFRFGAEYRFMIFALRGGFAYYGSPYADNDKLGAMKAYSVGFGVRERNYFVDIAYQLQKSKEDFYMYDIAPVANQNISSNSIYLTFGLRF